MKYSTHSDIYTYKDAPDVLINNFNIKDAKKLQELEKMYIEPRILEHDKYPTGNYDLKHWQTMHKYLFKDLYPWAGEIRQVTTIKGNTIFCKPEYIEAAHKDVYKELKKEDFLKNYSKQELSERLAYFHVEYNMVHPFREGNSRSLRALFAQMIKKEHDIILDYKNITAQAWKEASIAGAAGNYKPMAILYKDILSAILSATLNKDKKLAKNYDFSR